MTPKHLRDTRFLSTAIQDALHASKASPSSSPHPRRPRPPSPYTPRPLLPLPPLPPVSLDQYGLSSPLYESSFPRPLPSIYTTSHFPDAGYPSNIDDSRPRRVFRAFIWVTVAGLGLYVLLEAPTVGLKGEERDDLLVDVRHHTQRTDSIRVASLPMLQRTRKRLTAACVSLLVCCVLC